VKAAVEQNLEDGWVVYNASKDYTIPFPTFLTHSNHLTTYGHHAIFWHINHMTTSGRNATVLSVLLGDLNLIAESTE
jgi:hypothetical protein